MRHARFNQPDPYDGSYDLADPQSLNRYAYVQSDPVNFVDPTGLFITNPDDDIDWRLFVALMMGWDSYMGINVYYAPSTLTGYLHPFDVSGIRSELERMLANPGCATFVSELLSRVKSESNPLEEGGGHSQNLQQD